LSDRIARKTEEKAAAADSQAVAIQGTMGRPSVFYLRAMRRLARAAFPRRKGMDMIHRKSRRVLVAALGGACLLIGIGPASAAIGAEFHAVLSGSNIGPTRDRDGWGRAEINVSDNLDALCSDLEVRSVGEVVSAQIHRGGAGEDGPPVVKLDTPEDEDSDDCDPIGDTLADEIQSNPSGFYIAVKTRDFPNGAIRGQLAPGGD
jgi:hypothetical protein